MDSSAPEDSAESNNDALTGNEYMAKRQRTDASEVTNPWHMGIFFFERYVCESARVAFFFAHLREAPSLINRVQDRVLALLLLKFQIKIWDIIDFFCHGV